MNKCKHCGAELPEGAKFCPVCSKAVEESQTKDVTVKSAETVEQLLKQINEKIENIEKDAVRQENLQQMVKDAIEMTNKKADKEIDVQRKGEFSVQDAPSGNVVGQYKMHEIMRYTVKRTPEEIMNGWYPSKGNQFENEVFMLQEWNDKIYLLSKLLRTDPRNLKMWNQFRDVINNSSLAKAMDTATSGEGSEWIPTGFSSRLIERYLLELKVAKLFDILPMPYSPFTPPYQTSGATGYYVQESTADSSTKIKASTPGTGRATFTARKIAARVLISDEAVEDSMVPMLPFIERDIATAIAEAVEDAIINGDRSSSHQDSITDTEDARFAWYGLRYLTQSSAKVSFAGADPTAALMRDIRQKMGKYGVDPSKLAYLVSINAYLKLMEDDDVRTVDEYGQQATVLRGVLAKLDNISLIVSEKLRDTYDSNGVGTSSNLGVALCVFRPGFELGERRTLTINSKFDIETDQTIVVAKTRADFQPNRPYTSDYIVAQGYNIKTT